MGTRGEDLIGSLTAHLKANSIPFRIGGAGRSHAVLTFGPLRVDQEADLRRRWGDYTKGARGSPLG
jgi:hypothetical protein